MAGSQYPFQLRRDSSADQIPVAGLQDGIDAVDTLLWGTMLYTETLNTDATGFVTLTYHPVDVSHDYETDQQGIGRERRVDGADISAQTGGAATLYVGEANAATKRVPLFSDGAMTVAAANLTGVQVTYRRAIPLTLDSNGNLVTVSGGGTGTVVDLSDRAARQLGQISSVAGAQFDTSDRSGRALGQVTYKPGWQLASSSSAGAGSQASVTKGAATGVTHVLRTLAASLMFSTSGASGTVVVRDGPSNTGNIVWVHDLQITAQVAADRVVIPDLFIEGTSGNALTAEFSAGSPGAIQKVSITGHDR